LRFSLHGGACRNVGLKWRNFPVKKLPRTYKYILLVSMSISISIHWKLPLVRRYNIAIGNAWSMSSAILDIQCVLYIIKEISVVDLEGLASQHWIFKHSRTPNTAKIEAVNMWLFRNCHRLSTDCGDVRYSEITTFRMHLRERRGKAADQRKIPSRCQNLRFGLSTTR